METKVTPVEFNLTHTEFYTYIESFPNQRHIEEREGNLPQKQVILDQLRNDLKLLASDPKKVQNKLCYRTCFKWLEKEYIDFCLDKKCGNPGFENAAKELNYVK